MRILYLTANPQWVRKDPPENQQTTIGTGKKRMTPAERRKLFKKYAPLKLWEELKKLTDILFDARGEGRVSLEVVPEIDRGDVVRYVGSRRPNVVHFSGHGEKGELILNGSFDQAGEKVPEEWLAGVLADRGIDVLVLNCCWSATIAESMVEQMKSAAPLVIGTTKEVGSREAAEFTEAFYDALQQCATLREAYRSATADKPGLYKAFPSEDDDRWNRQLTLKEPEVASSTDDTAKSGPPAEPTEPAPEQVLHGYQEEVSQIRGNLWFSMAWDLAMVIIGFEVALIGFLLINGHYENTLTAIATWLADPVITTGAWEWVDKTLNFIFTPFVWLLSVLAKPISWVLSGLSQINNDLASEDAKWLQWEPLAIMTALASVPVARLASFFWVFLGSTYARVALVAVGAQPEEKIRKELASGRIPLMLKRLKEYEL